ncbi:2-C-methyl-D-erythritol 4-phosphate cytidylyltransferase [Salinithrix halophila]|uniref:2-C-methyl-D-erythritol 4-phosphate cytidylyltransferase n=1 Tax=Salinithrix halophila TaxID=1485204 RepID=A0ABV8JCI9_9BACL
MRVGVVIPAAGIGKRMGSTVSKQFLDLAGEPVLIRTLRIFDSHPAVGHIVLAVREEEQEAVESLLARHGFDPGRVLLTKGGEERQESVFQGLKRVNAEWVLVHDAVRPFVTQKNIDELLKAVQETGAAILAVPVKDTVKQVSPAGYVEKTLERSRLWAVQTPQAFSRALLLEAHAKGAQADLPATDDAMLAEALGVSVKVVRGDYANLKLTTPEDLVLAEAIWKMRRSADDQSGTRV